MSHSVLSGPLFHGTTAEIPMGDKVVPVGRGNSKSVHSSQGYRWGQRSDEHAFASEKEREAWDYAEMAEAGPRKPGSYGSNEPPKGRARVYKVEPAADQVMGRYHPDHPANLKAKEWDRHEPWHEHLTKTGFKVVGQEDIKPGRQGTIPIDWRPSLGNPRSHHDVNHPYPGEAEHGHMGSQFSKDNFHNLITDDEVAHGDNMHTKRAREMTTAQVPGQGTLL